MPVEFSSQLRDERGRGTEAPGVSEFPFLNAGGYNLALGQPIQLGSLLTGSGVDLGGLRGKVRRSLMFLPLRYKQGPPASFQKSKGSSEGKGACAQWQGSLRVSGGFLGPLWSTLFLSH